MDSLKISLAFSISQIALEVSTFFSWLELSIATLAMWSMFAPICSSTQKIRPVAKCMLYFPLMELWVKSTQKFWQKDSSHFNTHTNLIKSTKGYPKKLVDYISHSHLCHRLQQHSALSVIATLFLLSKHDTNLCKYINIVEV